MTNKDTHIESVIILASSRWVTAREAAKHLFVTSRAVRYMIARGELVGVRRGDGWRISTASVRKRLRAMR